MDECKGANRWRQQYVERGRGKRWNFAVKQSGANERCYLIALFGCSDPSVGAEMSRRLSLCSPSTLFQKHGCLMLLI